MFDANTIIRFGIYGSRWLYIHSGRLFGNDNRGLNGQQICDLISQPVRFAF